MSSMKRKFVKNKIRNIYFNLAIKFKCPICGFERLVYESEFKKRSNQNFKNNKLFICDKCNIRMNPITVEADF